MDKITHIYDSYKDILDEFGKEYVQERFNDLYTAYDAFINDRNLQEKVKINSFILAHAILDYFTDISRLKHFHKIQQPNSFKVISYEICWLLRRKPLQVIKDEEEELVYINEKFVLSYLMSYLTQLVGSDFYDKLSKECQASFNGFIDTLYYYLKYRNCNSQTLEFALLSFGAGVVSTNTPLKST